jgi:hypothetical protein
MAFVVMRMRVGNVVRLMAGLHLSCRGGKLNERFGVK